MILNPALLSVLALVLGTGSYRVTKLLTKRTGAQPSAELATAAHDRSGEPQLAPSAAALGQAKRPRAALEKQVAFPEPSPVESLGVPDELSPLQKVIASGDEKIVT